MDCASNNEKPSTKYTQQKWPKIEGQIQKHVRDITNKNVEVSYTIFMREVYDSI